MASRDQVELFLSSLKTKAKLFGIAFKPRDKNTQGLADLDILPIEREQRIHELTYKNYVSGPHDDTLYPEMPQYFVFGMKMGNGEMAYIKLSPGLPNKRVICMSFHKAERGLDFPMKDLK